MTKRRLEAVAGMQTTAPLGGALGVGRRRGESVQDSSSITPAAKGLQSLTGFRLSSMRADIYGSSAAVSSNPVLPAAGPATIAWTSPGPAPAVPPRLPQSISTDAPLILLTLMAPLAPVRQPGRTPGPSTG